LGANWVFLARGKGAKPSMLNPQKSGEIGVPGGVHPFELWCVRMNSG